MVNDTCVTISYGKISGRARQYKYYQPALYKKSKLKKYNYSAWKYQKHILTAYRSYTKCYRIAMEYSEQHSIPFLSVTNNTPIYEDAPKILKITKNTKFLSNGYVLIITNKKFYVYCETETLFDIWGNLTDRHLIEPGIYVITGKQICEVR